MTSSEQPVAADLIEAAASAGGFATFIDIANRAGLTAMLKAPTRHTLFAPTDEAFAKLPAGALDKLTRSDSADALKAFVRVHLVIGRVRADRFVGKRMHGKSVEGTALVIDGADGVSVNGAIVVRPDIMAANGVLHGVDRVLWPTSAGLATAPVG